MARVCVWADVSLADAELLTGPECSAVEALQERLRAVLGLPGELSSKQAAIELDLYTYAVLFARKQRFNPAQTSAMFTILKCVHGLCTSTPFDNQHEAFQHFKALLLCHSVNRPPHSTCLYSVAQLRELSEYVLQSYFKHYKLYKYAFTKRVRLDVQLGEGEEGEPVGENQTQLEGGGGEPQEEEDEPATVEDAEEEGEELAEPRPPDPLQELIAEKISEKMRELNVSVEQQLAEQEKRVGERISALESTSGRTSKKKK